METPKISPALSDHLKQVEEGAPVEVVLELAGRPAPADASLSRQEKISTLKACFQEDSAPVERVLKENGGQLIDQAWINQTLRVRVSANSLKKLAELNEVSAIDIPRSITSDY